VLTEIKAKNCGFSGFIRHQFQLIPLPGNTNATVSTTAAGARYRYEISLCCKYYFVMPLSNGRPYAFTVFFSTLFIFFLFFTSSVKLNTD